MRLIIGGSKKEVIKNIQKNLKDKELNKKVEVNDPKLGEEEIAKIIEKFYHKRQHKIIYFWQNHLAFFWVDILGKKLDKDITLEGLDNIENINQGAIITSNHFNPIDNMAIRKLVKKRYKKNLYIVSQETNLAMPGIIGFLMNNLNIIPIWKKVSYIIKEFKPKLYKILAQNNYVLIYPEEEMWFNYRLPRPCKRGAYEFAAEADVPIISCFVEIVDTGLSDNEEFNKVKYIVHILKPIYPDKNKSIRQNSLLMAELDYKQKIAAYEQAYHKKLDYTYSSDDIAGLKK